MNCDRPKSSSYQSLQSLVPSAGSSIENNSGAFRHSTKGKPMTLNLAVSAMAVLIGLTGSAAAQSNYPDRPIRFIVGASTPNNVARIIGEKLTVALGQPIVVEMVGGAGGNVAAGTVARSAPDGYTIFISGDAALTTNVTLFEKLPYDPLKDLVPITLLVDSTNILAVHPSVPAKNIQELVALAKTQPGKLVFGSGGLGTSQHLGGELLKSMAGIDLLHAPYRGGDAVLPDLLGGRVTMMFGNISSLLPLVQDGRLRGLAVTSLKRSPQAPDLPTIDESGFPGFQATAWVGMVAPAGTPEAIIRKLHEETTRVLAVPATRERLTSMGFTVVGSTPSDFTAQIKAEISSKGKVLRDAGVKLN